MFTTSSKRPATVERTYNRMAFAHTTISGGAAARLAVDGQASTNAQHPARTMPAMPAERNTKELVQRFLWTGNATFHTRPRRTDRAPAARSLMTARDELLAE